jgi:hypothetical protein
MCTVHIFDKISDLFVFRHFEKRIHKDIWVQILNVIMIIERCSN